MSSRLLDAGGEFLVDASGNYLVWQIEGAGNTASMSLTVSAATISFATSAPTITITTSED